MNITQDTTPTMRNPWKDYNFYHSETKLDALYESLGMADLDEADFVQAHNKLVFDFAQMRQAAIKAGVEPYEAYKVWIELRKGAH